jgi:hypothetical protein
LKGREGGEGGSSKKKFEKNVVIIYWA